MRRFLREAFGERFDDSVEDCSVHGLIIPRQSPAGEFEPKHLANLTAHPFAEAEQKRDQVDPLLAFGPIRPIFIGSLILRRAKTAVGSKDVLPGRGPSQNAISTKPVWVRPNGDTHK